MQINKNLFYLELLMSGPNHIRIHCLILSKQHCCPIVSKEQSFNVNLYSNLGVILDEIILYINYACMQIKCVLFPTRELVESGVV